MLPGLHQYFAAVGLPAPDLRGLIERVSDLSGRGERVARPGGGTVVNWRDVCGAAVTIFLDADSSIVGALPYSTSARRTRVIPRDIEKDPDFDFYDRLVVTVVDRHNQGRFELTLLVQDLALARTRVQVGMPMNVAISAAADRWRVCAPEVASSIPGIEGQTGLVPLAEPGFPHPSRVALRAHVLRVDAPLNRHSRVEFQHAKVKVGNVELDALVPEADEQAADQKLVAGAMVEGAFLLVGTLDPSRHDATMAGMRR